MKVRIFAFPNKPYEWCESKYISLLLVDEIFSSPFKRQTHEVVKRIQTICWQQQTSCLSVFGYAVGLALKGLNQYNKNIPKIEHINPFVPNATFLCPLKTLRFSDVFRG